LVISQPELVAATVRLVSRHGKDGASIRAIAREAGMTEGAIYRHYESKEGMCWDAYRQIVDEMILEKKRVTLSAAPLRERLREWVRLSYAYFDRAPEAFTFVLLTPGVVPPEDEEVTTSQGCMFMEMIREALSAGEVRPISAELALSHFSGVMLNVPRLVNEGLLEGPALQYVDDVADTVWRMLRP
jgi:AcrR family transcriptional regulator